jgi:two-component system, sensor histidine kinase and response regulator
MERQSTVLIVDDDTMARDVIEGLLFREGYQLDFAESGQQALAYLEKQLPDLILLDVMMPEMDGFTLCERLKASEQWRHIPIILVTALGSKEDLARGFEAGADDFLHKPVEDVELRARVRAMLRIKRQYDELQEAMRLREELAHLIVHDMRTPLSAIIGFSTLLQVKATLSPEELEDVDKIHTQAQRLNSFLNDMLMVAKMETAGHFTLNKVSVDLNQLVEQVEQSQEIVARLKKITLISRLPLETRQVWLDDNLFHRLLDNLISNALKFSPPESTVIVQLEYLAEEQDLAARPQFRLQVIDQGPGIPEEDRQRIFDKFEVVALKQRNITQVGLGLTFCKMAVEAHQGCIFVEANEPVGSIFTVEI